MMRVTLLFLTGRVWLIFLCLTPWSAVAQNLQAPHDETEALYQYGRSWDPIYRDHLDTNGLHVDIFIASLYYEQAALRGHVPAMHELGRIWHDGGLSGGIYLDRKKAIAYYEQAASLGYERSQRALGQIYLGYGYNHLPANRARGLHYYHKLIEKGDITALYSLAQVYFFPATNNDGVAPEGLQDYVTARQYFEQVVTLEKEKNIQPEDYGYTREASIYLGNIYRDGLGVDVDLTQAARYFELAVEYGDQDDAMAELGWFYLHGLGVEKNLVLAKKYLLQIEEKSTVGRDYLAHIYMVGDIVEKDVNKAMYHRSCALEENETCCFYAECSWDPFTGEWMGN